MGGQAGGLQTDGRQKTVNEYAVIHINKKVQTKTERRKNTTKLEILSRSVT